MSAFLNLHLQVPIASTSVEGTKHIFYSNMSFWGTEVKPGKVVPFVPPPQDARLHISQACLAEGAGELEKRASLFMLVASDVLHTDFSRAWRLT